MVKYLDDFFYDKEKEPQRIPLYAPPPPEPLPYRRQEEEEKPHVVIIDPDGRRGGYVIDI